MIRIDPPLILELVVFRLRVLIDGNTVIVIAGKKVLNQALAIRGVKRLILGYRAFDQRGGPP